jgi:hypothetical protein
MERGDRAAHPQDWPNAKDGEWLAITPEGFFAASKKGADVLSVVRGFEVYSIDQLFQALYRPDLVRDKLAGDPKGLVREAAVKLDLEKVIASGNAPTVRQIDRNYVDNIYVDDRMVSDATGSWPRAPRRRARLRHHAASGGRQRGQTRRR